LKNNLQIGAVPFCKKGLTLAKRTVLNFVDKTIKAEI